MAGDCRHTALLEASLKHCHDESGLMASTHETYRKIIDDLKNDLEQISCEVIMVQKECTDQDGVNDTHDIGDLELSLKALESQNDRLQQALELQTQTKETAFQELQTNNESLKCQIEHLRRTLCERDQRIMQLTGLLKSFSQVQSNEPHQAALEFVNSRNNFAIDQQRKIEALNQKLDKSMQEQRFLHKEARKLNQDLNEAKNKNAELISQVTRLGDLLKSQESHRMQLAAKYEDLETNYEDQAKKLRTANNQLCLLNERFHVMERRQCDHNMENTILREEVLSLKEKHACAVGNQKSLQEQLIKTEKELYTAHNVIKEQQAIMQRNECNHNEMIQRLTADNCDLKRKLSQLIEDYKRLQEEHDKQKETNDHQCKLLESYSKWKEQQLKAETKTREGFKQLEDLIRNLLEEKRTYLDHYWDLQKDYTLLQSELDRLKVCSFSVSNYSALRNSSEKSIAERLEIVRRTTQRVSEQSSSIKEDERDAGLIGSTSTPVLPSEEPL